MGYDLWNGQGHYFRANIGGWDHLFQAALAFGWKPASSIGAREKRREEFKRDLRS